MSGSQYLYIIGISPSPSGHPGNPSWFVGPSLEVSWHGASPTSSELSSTCRCIQAIFWILHLSWFNHGLSTWRIMSIMESKILLLGSPGPGWVTEFQDVHFHPRRHCCIEDWHASLPFLDNGEEHSGNMERLFFKIQTTIKACKNICVLLALGFTI